MISRLLLVERSRIKLFMGTPQSTLYVSIVTTQDGKQKK